MSQLARRADVCQWRQQTWWRCQCPRTLRDIQVGHDGADSGSLTVGNIRRCASDKFGKTSFKCSHFVMLWKQIGRSFCCSATPSANLGRLFRTHRTLGFPASSLCPTCRESLPPWLHPVSGARRLLSAHPKHPQRKFFLHKRFFARSVHMPAKDLAKKRTHSRNKHTHTLHACLRGRTKQVEPTHGVSTS